jgi:two-component system KDP operon response regulator KdpE
MQTGKQRRLVLAVDDHPSILRFVQTGLEIRGFEVMTAASGKEAVTLVRSANPDVVLLDIMMPDTDGLEVLKQIRSMSDVPVIAFSAYHEARKDALRLGADDFVPKPFNTDDMVARIRPLLGTKHPGRVTGATQRP